MTDDHIQLHADVSTPREDGAVACIFDFSHRWQVTFKGMSLRVSLDRALGHAVGRTK